MLSLLVYHAWKDTVAAVAASENERMAELQAELDRHWGNGPAELSSYTAPDYARQTSDADLFALTLGERLRSGALQRAHTGRDEAASVRLLEHIIAIELRDCIRGASREFFKLLDGQLPPALVHH